MDIASALSLWAMELVEANRKGGIMQEIEYEDGTKTKKKFDSFFDALIDAEEKAKKKQINVLKITRLIPSKKRK